MLITTLGTVWESFPRNTLIIGLCKHCDCSLKSCTTRDLRKTGYISADEVTKVSSGAMKIFSTSMVTSNSSILQPKIEVNSSLEDDLNFGPFQQLETQLLDSMEISEQQPSHSPKPEGDYSFALTFYFLGGIYEFNCISSLFCETIV